MYVAPALFDGAHPNRVNPDGAGGFVGAVATPTPCIAISRSPALCPSPEIDTVSDVA
jgi:hypothetical protein